MTLTWYNDDTILLTDDRGVLLFIDIDIVYYLLIFNMSAIDQANVAGIPILDDRYIIDDIRYSVMVMTCYSVLFYFVIHCIIGYSVFSRGSIVYSERYGDYWYILIILMNDVLKWWHWYDHIFSIDVLI